MVKRILRSYLSSKFGDEGAERLTDHFSAVLDSRSPVTLKAPHIDLAFRTDVLEAHAACLAQGLLVLAPPSADGTPGELLVLKPEIMNHPDIKTAIERHGPWTYLTLKP